MSRFLFYLFLLYWFFELVNKIRLVSHVQYEGDEELGGEGQWSLYCQTVNVID